jgi:hypothetical protein
MKYDRRVIAAVATILLSCFGILFWIYLLITGIDTSTQLGRYGSKDMSLVYAPIAIPVAGLLLSAVGLISFRRGNSGMALSTAIASLILAVSIMIVRGASAAG